jgi:hypothetical protein
MKRRMRTGEKLCTFYKMLIYDLALLRYSSTTKRVKSTAHRLFPFDAKKTLSLNASPTLAASISRSGESLLLLSRKGGVAVEPNSVGCAPLGAPAGEGRQQQPPPQSRLRARKLTSLFSRATATSLNSLYLWLEYKGRLATQPFQHRSQHL